MPTTRRTLLKSAAASTLLATVPSILKADAPDSNDQFTTALIGCGWWGTNILTEALAANRSKVVALCDPDPHQLDTCIKNSPLGNATPKRYTDYRDLLEKERPQIVINATPDHWHAQITIDAVKSGSHVYVEKPVSHTVLEGLAMVKAARHADRVVQVGTHRRASPHCIAAREFIRSGKLGKLGSARAFVHYGGTGPETPSPNADPPKGMDWDLYCGPAPLRPFNPKIHTRGFRQFLDFANGQLGDWGIHWLDQILWVAGYDHPSTVYSTGGRSIKGPPVNDQRGQTTDSPDHQIATFSFPDDFTAHWEHRMFAGNSAEKGENVGVYFYGTTGTLHLGWQSGFTVYPINPKEPTQHMDATLHTPSAHNIKELWADFLHAVDTRSRPMCDIETGHRSTTCALLGMLSLKLDRALHWDPATHTIKDDPQATSLLQRPYRSPWTYPRT